MNIELASGAAHADQVVVVDRRESAAYGGGVAVGLALLIPHVSDRIKTNVESQTFDFSVHEEKKESSVVCAYRDGTGSGASDKKNRVKPTLEAI